VAAIDLGATNLKAALFDHEGRKLAEVVEEAEKEDAERLVAQLVGVVDRIAADPGLRRAPAELTALGVCVPGNVETASRRVVASPNYPLLTRLDLFAELEAATGLVTAGDNDGDAAALGEARFGGFQAEPGTLVFLTLGTGVGGGVVIDGRLLRGRSGFAAELGHLVVEPDGEPCGCGGWGGLEQVASAPAIVRRARQATRRFPESTWVNRTGRDLTARRVAEGAVAGDPLCREVLAEVGRGLGLALAGLVNVFNPNWIVLGGGVSGAGDWLLAPAVAEARRRAFSRPFDDCEFRISRLGADVGLYGAFALACEAAVAVGESEREGG